MLIIERAADMRSHAGQCPSQAVLTIRKTTGPIDTALREAQEETGLEPSGVVPVAALPPDVVAAVGIRWQTPVLGWWREPSPISAMDPAEVADVHRVAISDLVAPANRVKVSHPSGYIGAGFEVDGMLVWGFTGLLLDRLFALAGGSCPGKTPRAPSRLMMGGGRRRAGEVTMNFIDLIVLAAVILFAWSGWRKWICCGASVVHRIPRRWPRWCVPGAAGARSAPHRRDVRPRHHRTARHQVTRSQDN